MLFLKIFFNPEYSRAISANSLNSLNVNVCKFTGCRRKNILAAPMNQYPQQSTSEFIHWNANTDGRQVKDTESKERSSFKIKLNPY